MDIMTFTPDQLTGTDIKNINEVASAGFGRKPDETMLRDTEAHIASADEIQLATCSGELVGFAFYRSCLWR